MLSCQRMVTILAVLFAFMSNCMSINLQMYNNSVLYGESNALISLNSLDHAIFIDTDKYHEFSAKIEGTIMFINDINKYYFNCKWDATIFGFVWIDDHLICAPSVYQNPIVGFWNLTFTSSAFINRKSFIRVNIYSKIQSQNITNKTIQIPFSIQWSVDNNQTYSSINSSYLSSDIPIVQQKRLSLQNNLTNNTWSPWFFNNILSTVRLPDSFGFTIGGCTSKTDCHINAIVEDGNLNVGAKSIDLESNSYFEYNFTYEEYMFQYQYATMLNKYNISNLYVLIKLIKQTTSFVAVNTRFFWYRHGTVQIDTSDDNKCYIKIIPYGLNKTWQLCSNKNISGYISVIDSLVFGVTSSEPIYFTTDTTINDISQIETIISNAQLKEYSTYTKYGNLSTTKLAIQAGLLWNVIYTPEENVIAPVSRAWSGSNIPNGWDFDFILFDWDNIFASWMLSFDSTAMDIAISNLIQVIKSKT
eukprot:372447_1